MKNTLLLSFFLFGSFTFSFAQDSFKTQNAYLKIDDIKGEIISSKLLTKSGMEIDMWNDTMMVRRIIDQGGIIIIQFDKSSPFVSKLKSGRVKRIPSMELRKRNSRSFIEQEGGPDVYLKYKLDRCFIKSWSTSGDADDRPTEEVAFYYNKIAFD